MGSGAERWLLTYADMITLLLALFILLFAMSTINVHRFDELRRSLSDSFRGHVMEGDTATLPGARSVLDPSAANASLSKTPVEIQQQAAAEQAKAATRQKQNIEQTLRSAGLTVNDKNGDVEVATTERGIVVRLAGDAFFDSGSDAIKPRLARKLKGLAIELKHDGRPLSVEGHTDGQPINTAQFPDNLALSSARAASIYRLLASLGIASTKMRAVGYADTKPVQQPRHPQDSVARNRRVEIVIMAPGSTNAQPAAGDRLNTRGGSGGAGGTGPAIDPLGGNGPAPVQIIDPITVISQ